MEVIIKEKTQELVYSIEVFNEDFFSKKRGDAKRLRAMSFVMKIDSWGGVNFAWQLPKGWYSISLGLVRHIKENTIEKIYHWGYLWEDTDGQRILQKSKLSNKYTLFAEKTMDQFRIDLQIPLDRLRTHPDYANYVALFKNLDSLFFQLIEGKKEHFEKKIFIIPAI